MKFTEKKNILFIDDDKRLLLGIERLIRNKRHDWNFKFIEGGENAIKHIDSNPLDIVVTDMKMPNLSGSDVLKHTAIVQPNCLRFILSGQADKKEIEEVANITHQFIQKPCPVNVIVLKIEQALNAIDILELSSEKDRNNTYRELMNCIKKSSFLCLHDNLRKLEEMLTKHSLLDDDLINFILSDIGITTKIMQLYSSDFYDNSKKELDIKKALAAIGKDTLIQLVKNQNIFKNANDKSETRIKNVNKYYNQANLEDTEKTLLALKLSAGVLGYENELEVEIEKLKFYSLQLCSLWGIEIDSLIKNFKEAKMKKKEKHYE